MAYEKDIDTILNELHTAHENKTGAQPGTLSRIKYSAMAVVFWGVYKYLGWIMRQYFVHLCDTEALRFRGAERGLYMLPGETVDAFRSRVLSNLRQPPEGGNANDYEQWAREYVSPYAKFVLEAGMFATGGLLNFSAAAAVDSLVNAKAWDTDGCSSGDYLAIDLGSEKDICMLLLNMSEAGCDASYRIEYSDDNIAYSVAAAAWVPEYAGWNKLEWASVGAHRYWAIYLTNAPASAVYVTEIEVYEVGSEGVSSAFIIPEGQGAGTVDIIAFSNSDTTELPTQGMIFKLKEYIDTKRPVTAYFARVLAPEILETDVTVTVVGDGLRADMKTAVEAMLNSKLCGQDLYHTEITAVIMGYGASDAVVTLPATTVSVSDYQVVRAGNVTVT